MNDRQHREIEQAPESCKTMLRRAFFADLSPRQAIKVFCLQCVGFSRSDIKNCSARACALHAYRPYQDDIEQYDEAAE